MLELPSLETLIATYPAEIASERIKLSEVLGFLTEKVSKQSFRVMAEDDDIDINPDHFTAVDAEFLAIQLMVRDLKHYRERARNIVDNYRDSRYDTETAIRDTNTIIGRLTGFRVFLEDFRTPLLGDVEHARCDTRILVLQEEILTKLVRAVDIKENIKVFFSPANGITR